MSRTHDFENKKKVYRNLPQFLFSVTAQHTKRRRVTTNEPRPLHATGRGIHDVSNTGTLLVTVNEA